MKDPTATILSMTRGDSCFHAKYKFILGVNTRIFAPLSRVPFASNGVEDAMEQLSKLQDLEFSRLYVMTDSRIVGAEELTIDGNKLAKDRRGLIVVGVLVSTRAKRSVD